MVVKEGIPSNKTSLAEADNAGRVVFRRPDSETEDVLEARGRLAHGDRVLRRVQSASQAKPRGAANVSESLRPASAAGYEAYSRPDPFALLHDKYTSLLNGKASQPAYALSKYEKWLGLSTIKLHTLETLERLQEDLRGQDVPEELEEYLQNTRYLLGKVDKACKMLMRLASDKTSDKNGGQSQVSVFAGQTQGACRDLTIELSEALPQLISQVAMYQDRLCSTESKYKQKVIDYEALQKKYAELQELCNKERRQKEFFQQQRKKDLGDEAQKRALGLEGDNQSDVFDMLDSSGKDLDMLVYSERDLAEKKKEWKRKRDAEFAEERTQLETEWSKKCESERKKAAEELEKQRLELQKIIDDLRRQLGSAGGTYATPTGPNSGQSPQYDLGYLGEYDYSGGGEGKYGGAQYPTSPMSPVSPSTQAARTQAAKPAYAQSSNSEYAGNQYNERKIKKRKLKR